MVKKKREMRKKSSKVGNRRHREADAAGRGANRAEC
jgi:hypothetical protein